MTEHEWTTRHRRQFKKIDEALQSRKRLAAVSRAKRAKAIQRLRDGPTPDEKTDLDRWVEEIGARILADVQKIQEEEKRQKRVQYNQILDEMGMTGLARHWGMIVLEGLDLPAVFEDDQRVSERSWKRQERSSGKAPVKSYSSRQACIDMEIILILITVGEALAR